MSGTHKFSHRKTDLKKLFAQRDLFACAKLFAIILPLHPSSPIHRHGRYCICYLGIMVAEKSIALQGWYCTCSNWQMLARKHIATLKSLQNPCTHQMHSSDISSLWAFLYTTTTAHLLTTFEHYSLVLPRAQLSTRRGTYRPLWKSI